MAISGVPRKRITITILAADYELLQLIAKEMDVTAAGYIRRLVTHHLWNKKVERYQAAEQRKHSLID